MRMSMKAARINRKLTQEAVAEALNVTRKTVSFWENGKTKPSLDKIEPICKLYQVGYDDIEWSTR